MAQLKKKLEIAESGPEKLTKKEVNFWRAKSETIDAQIKEYQERLDDAAPRAHRARRDDREAAGLKRYAQPRRRLPSRDATRNTDAAATTSSAGSSSSATPGSPSCGSSCTSCADSPRRRSRRRPRSRRCAARSQASSARSPRRTTCARRRKPTPCAPSTRSRPGNEPCAKRPRRASELGRPCGARAPHRRARRGNSSTCATTAPARRTSQREHRRSRTARAEHLRQRDG